jgi:DNA-binding response OmpR family regulator
MARLLVVNDEEDLVEVTKMILEAAGHEVATSIESERTMSLIDSFHPDLLLLDWVMPRMNGEKVITAVRASHGRRIPVLLMSASPDGADQARRVGAEGFVAKPFDVDELLRAIDDLTEIKEPSVKAKSVGSSTGS